MQRRTRTFLPSILPSILLTCGTLALGCGGGEVNTTVETTTMTTGESTTGTTGTTGEPATGSTTDTPTSAPTTTGESESGTGTTTDAATTGSTGPVTGEGTTGETGSTGVETTTGETTVVDTTGGTTGSELEPISFAECQDGMAASCPDADPACLVVDGPGGGGGGGSFFVTWSYCTRECESDADCVSGLEGGSAKPKCLPKGANDVKVCVLDCSFGKTCPKGLECSYDDACGTKYCDCSGDGCDDFLCQ